MLGGIVIFLAQIWATQWHWQYLRQLEFLNYGLPLLGLMVTEVALGLISGAILSLLLWPKLSNGVAEPGPGTIVISGVLLSLAPIIALIVRIGTVLGNWFHVLPYNEFWDWSVTSPVPALWLGVVAGAIIRQLFPAQVS